jgi:hypothetical protein
MSLQITDKGRTIIVTGTTSVSQKVTDELCQVSKVVWYGPTTAGQLLIVKDKDGDTIFPFVVGSTTSGVMITYDFPTPDGHPINGIYISDMDAGEVRFYIAARESAR